MWGNRSTDGTYWLVTAFGDEKTTTDPAKATTFPSEAEALGYLVAVGLYNHGWHPTRTDGLSPEQAWMELSVYITEMWHDRSDHSSVYANRKICERARELQERVQETP